MCGYFFQEGIGTVYHYLEPSREVECHRETVKTAVSCLEYKFKSEFKEEIMKVKRCVKESFVVIGKEGSTLDGRVLFKDYGLMQILILEKFGIWLRKMRMEI